MSIAEIRAAATASEDLTMKVERFIEERRRNICSSSSGMIFALTATPLLIEEGRIEISDRRLKELLQDPPSYRGTSGATVSYHGARVRPSITGLRATIENLSTLEIFRNGHIEFVLAPKDYMIGVSTGVSTIVSWMVAGLVNNFARFLHRLRAIAEISDPYLVTLSFWRCRNVSMLEFGGRHDLSGGNKFTDSDDLLLGPILVPADEPSDVTTRRLTDLFWNAFQFIRCPYFKGDIFSIPNR